MVLRWLAASRALGVRAAPAGTCLWFTALTQGTSNITSAATAAIVVSMIQAKEAILAGRTGLATHMSLAETLPIALALSNSTQRASWVTAAACAAFRVAGAQSPIPRFTAVTAWPLHMSPARTGSLCLRKGRIGWGQTSRMTRASFAVGEVIGPRHTHITTKSCHSGTAPTLASCRVTGCMHGAISRAVARDAAGKAVESGATFLTSGARVARTAAAQTTRSTLLIQGPPRVTGTSMTVGVPMVSWKAAVTVRTIKARSALAMARLVTALRQGPCWAAAT